MAYLVLKRDGSQVEFEIKKIEEAIIKAFEASSKQYNEDIISLLALRVCANFEAKIENGVINVEDIQDSAEKVLSEAGYSDVAKAYILYRKQREKARNLSSSVQNYKEMISNYLNDESQGHSIASLALNNSATLTREYWLEEIYDKEISAAHKEGEIYLHGLATLTPQECVWSLETLLEKGLPNVGEGNCYKAPKHFDAVCNQLAIFLSLMCNECFHSQNIPSFDTYLAPYIHADNLNYLQVKQGIESFIYHLNVGGLWLNLEHINIYLDWICPSDLKQQVIKIAGKEVNFNYQDCQKEMHLIQKALIEVLLEGDSEAHNFKKPYLYLPLNEECDYQDDLGEQLFKLATKCENIFFINYHQGKQLHADMRFLRKHRDLAFEQLNTKAHSFKIKGEDSGCLARVDLNLISLKNNSKSEAEFYNQLNRYLVLIRRSLKRKRETLVKLFNNGLYPLSRQLLEDYELYYCSIGICGLSYLKEQGFNIETLFSHIDELIRDYSIEDKLFYELLLCNDKEKEYFISLNSELEDAYSDKIFNYKQDELFDILDEEKALSIFNNCAFPIKIYDNNTDPKSLAKLLNKIVKNYPYPLFRIIGR